LNRFPFLNASGGDDSRLVSFTPAQVTTLQTALAQDGRWSQSRIFRRTPEVSMMLPLALLLVTGGPSLSDTSSGWVVLPIEEYRSLHDKAYPQTPQQDKPRVDATLTRVDYELHATHDTAIGEAQLTIDIIRDGWVRVPIPAPLTVRAARLDGHPVPLIDLSTATAKGGSGPALLLTKPGRKVVTLEIAIPVTSSGGQESLSLPTGTAACGRVRLTVPGTGLNLKLTNGLLVESTSERGETRWVADGGGNAPLLLSWQHRVEVRRAELPLRLRGSVTEFVALGEETAQLTAHVRVDVVRGSATHASLLIPEGLQITHVSGNNVADWDARNGELKVTFLEPVDSAEGIGVMGEARVPREGSLGIPLLRLQGVEREEGGVGVEVQGAGEITSQESRGLNPADPKSLGDPVAGHDSPLLLALGFQAQDVLAPRSLMVTVARYTPQAVLVAMVEEARYEVLAADDGKMLVRGRYAVRNNQKSFLDIALPSDATLWSTSVAGRTVRPGVGNEGRILVPLEKGKTGEDPTAFPVELVYLHRLAAWSPREGRLHLPLPALDLSVTRTGILLHTTPLYRIVIDPGAFREEPYSPPASVALQEVPPGAGRTDADGTASRAVKSVWRHGTVPASAFLPLQVPFPAFGGILFLAGELTKEGEAPGVDLRYKKTSGGRS
jgi:hypothetical protein